MKNRLPKRMNRRMILYIITLFLFFMCIIVMYGFKTSVDNYYEESIDTYRESRWDSLWTNYKAARSLVYTDLNTRALNIQNEIKTELDMNKLKESLTNNTYYSDFDEILRNNLQSNVLINGSKSMDRNRNSIFVICNGKIIANYAHDEMYGVPYKEGQQIEGNDLKEIIKEEYYNKELSLNALNQIETQSSDMIVWQSRSNNGEKISTFTTTTMRKIFEQGGISCFESYEILIPVYITEYGNIFDEHDTAVDPTVNNKIIIVQKMNLKDYLMNTMPGADILSDSKLVSLEDHYNNLKIVIGIFEIILYVCIIMYVLFVVFSINQIVDSLNADDLKRGNGEDKA